MSFRSRILGTAEDDVLDGGDGRDMILGFGGSQDSPPNMASSYKNLIKTSFLIGTKRL